MQNINLNQGHADGQMMTTNPPTRVVDSETEFLYKKLIILLHSYRCLRLEQSGKLNTGTCELPHSEEMKSVLRHMEKCTEGKRCKVPSCVPSRQIILHWRTCYKLQCDTCFPLLETENQPLPLSTPMSPDTITNIQPLRLTKGPLCGGDCCSGQMTSSPDPDGVPVPKSIANQHSVSMPAADSYSVPMPHPSSSSFVVPTTLSDANPCRAPMPSPNEPHGITVQSPLASSHGVPTPPPEYLCVAPTPTSLSRPKSNSWDRGQQGGCQPMENSTNFSVAIKREDPEESVIGYSSPFPSNQ